MKTKYNVGDIVLVKGTVRRITVDKEGVIYYDLDIDYHRDLYSYGNARVTEKELDEIMKEREKE